MPERTEVGHSRIKLWRRCHKAHDYRYNQQLEKKKPIIQLIRGTMIGKCLDAIAALRKKAKGMPWQKALEPYQKQYGRLFKEEQEYYGDPIGEVLQIIRRYEMIYANDGLTYYVPKGKKDPSEIELKVELAPGIDFTAHLDKYPMDKEGRYWVMDHKSHKKIPDEDARFADLQLLRYNWAAPLCGLPKPSGVVWDYIRTKPPTIPETLKAGGLSQRKNIDTDYETYLGEIKRLALNPSDYAEILGELKPRGFIDFYRRVWLPNPNKEMVNNIVNDTRETAIEIAKYGKTSTTRSMDRTCKQCQYYQLCQAEVRNLDAAFIRKSEYVVKQEPAHDSGKEEDE